MAPRLNFLPIALSKTLLEFQQEGVLFGISKNGRCLIGDEMGLGKTLQALSIAYYYKNEWPLLIVCPSSMRYPWIEEIEKWLPDIQPGEVNLVLSGTDASNIKTSKISIVGYGLLSRSTSNLLKNCLKDTKFGIVIVDESHYMKNRQASRTKALISVIKNAKRAILLTGTPALARPEELYVQIDVLKPNLLGSFNKFAYRFCEARMEHICGGRVRRWNTRGASNLDELHNILKTNVMIRRLKKNVLTELPPKRRQRITFDLADSDSKKEMEKVIKDFRETQSIIRGRSQNVISPNKNPVFEMKRLATLLYQQTGLSKISAVRQYIADILENSDKKFLVFVHHLDVMKAVELEVVKKKVKYIRIAGDTPSIIRGSLVNQFQNDGTVRVAILSLLAASIGITLTAADHIIFTELHWTPGVMEQAEDRAHRIGQKNSVLVQYLVAKGTIDEVLWRMLCSKVYVTTATLNGKTQGLDVEEGSESQSRLLEAFSAWIDEEEEEEDEAGEDECNLFLFTNSQQKRKQDALQRSLTEFFQLPSSKCRKTDDGKEWANQSDSSEEEKEEMSSTNEVSTTEAQECTVGEKDEENCLRKVTKKTYKIPKKKLVQLNCQVQVKTQKSEERNVIEILDSDDDDLPNPVEMTDSELTHEYYKMEDNKEKHLLDLVSKYTQIVQKPTLLQESSQIINENKSSEVININENNIKSDYDGSQLLGHLSSENQSNKVIDLTQNCSVVNVQEHENVQDTSDDMKYNVTVCVSKENNVIGNNDLNDFQPKDPWCCTLCTFINNGLLSICEICDTPRQKTRRKMTKTALSTPEFVKRRQQKILETCLEPEKKKKSRGSTSKAKKVNCAIKDKNIDRGQKGTSEDCAVMTDQVKACDEREKSSNAGHELLPRVNIYGDFSKINDENLPQTKYEDLPKTKHEDHPTKEHEVAPNIVHEELLKTKQVTEANTMAGDCNEVILEEYGGDVVVTSGCGVSDEKQATTTELVLPGNEFNDMTVDDWWECHNCYNFNYDESLEVCEQCGQTKTKTNDQLMDLVTNLDDDCWRCEDCGEFYFDDDIKKCTKCAEKEAKKKKDFAKIWEQFSHLFVDDCADSEGDSGIPKTTGNLMFCLSYYTDRVYLYSETGVPLNCNVSLLDLETSNAENIPNILMEPTNRKQALRFLRKWKSLPERQKRIVRKTGMIFDDPYQAGEAVKMGNEQKLCMTRFPSKETLQAEVMMTAVEKNGTVRHCRKGPRRTGLKTNTAALTSETVATDPEANQRTWIQAVDKNGQPLCIFCKSIVNTSNTNCEWDERFCSHNCKQNYQFRTSGTGVRQRLFEAEKGICQRCQFDAHGLYRNIKCLPKTERRGCLEDSSFISLPLTLLNKIIIDPKEGMFWEADHVVPVVEGGGECGLENYRTLCIPCHRHVTAELRERLKANRQKYRAEGIPDITSFFKP